MVENGEIDRMVGLLTDDAWLTMPPLPHAYQGPETIGAFLRGAEERRGAPMRLVPTRPNGHPALGCYLAPTDGAAPRALRHSRLTLSREQRRDRNPARPNSTPHAISYAAV